MSLVVIFTTAKAPNNPNFGMGYKTFIKRAQLSKSMNIICKKLESFSNLGRFTDGDVCEFELAYPHPGRARFPLLSFTSIELLCIFLLPFTYLGQLAVSESLALLLPQGAELVRRLPFTRRKSLQLLLFLADFLSSLSHLSSEYVSCPPFSPVPQGAEKVLHLLCSA